MAQSARAAANPFVLLMDPQSVFQAIEKSERLARLQSRVCHPLDKPLLPIVGLEAADAEVAGDSAEPAEASA